MNGMDWSWAPRDGGAWVVGEQQGGLWGMCVPWGDAPSYSAHNISIGFEIILEITFLCDKIHMAAGVCHTFFLSHVPL